MASSLAGFLHFADYGMLRVYDVIPILDVGNTGGLDCTTAGHEERRFVMSLHGSCLCGVSCTHEQ